jgi:molybdopterin/thiamine biosynthesis adenylyltransferase
MEHDYQNPDEAEARRAVGIADLCVRATDDERERASIVAVSWNAMSARAVVNDKVHYSFHEFNHRPMLFIDVFEDLQPPAAKIVDPDNKEVRLVTLNSFACKQAIELAQLLRGNYLRLPHFKWV